MSPSRVLPKPDRARASRPLAWLRPVDVGVLLAVLVVMAISSLPTLHVHQTLPHEQSAVAALERIQADSTQLKALEGGLFAGPQTQGQERLAADLLLNHMATQARNLADLQRGSAAVTAVEDLTVAFHELSPGSPERERVDYVLARDELQHAAATSTRTLEQRISKGKRQVRIGQIVVGIAVLLLLIAIVIRVDRARASAFRDVREVELKLSKRDELLVDSQQRLRLAESRYRNLVERLPGVTYVSSPTDVGPTYISPQALELLGRPAEEFITRPATAMEIVHPDDRESVNASMQALRRKGGEYTQEFRIVHPDGRVVWIGDDATVIVGDDEHPLHVQGYLRDITPVKDAEAEQRLVLERERAANEKLRELGALKDDFVALVSHELRTPLTSIRGYLELVLEGHQSALSKENGEFLGVVDRNAARLERLVDDLLFMARLGSGKLDLSLQDTDLAALALESVAAATPRAAAQAVEIAYALDEVPAVRGDPGRLGQLLDNLISNAVKFTPDGGHVDVRVFSQNGDVAVEIADTGIGIPAQEQKELFQKFFRASAAGERAIQGTGLGLSISKAIVEAHAGRIELESEENVGTTIRVLLPVSEAPLRA